MDDFKEYYIEPTLKSSVFIIIVELCIDIRMYVAYLVDDFLVFPHWTLYIHICIFNCFSLIYFYSLKLDFLILYYELQYNLVNSI